MNVLQNDNGVFSIWGGFVIRLQRTKTVVVFIHNAFNFNHLIVKGNKDMIVFS